MYTHRNEVKEEREGLREKREKGETVSTYEYTDTHTEVEKGTEHERETHTQASKSK